MAVLAVLAALAVAWSAVILVEGPVLHYQILAVVGAGVRLTQVRWIAPQGNSAFLAAPRKHEGSIGCALALWVWNTALPPFVPPFHVPVSLGVSLAPHVGARGSLSGSSGQKGSGTKPWSGYGIEAICCAHAVGRGSWWVPVSLEVPGSVTQLEPPELAIWNGSAMVKVTLSNAKST